MTTLILLLLVVPVLTVQWGGSWWSWGAVALGLLGGTVGVASAISALVNADSVTGTSGRVGLGLAALTPAVIAAGGALLARARPRRAVVVLLAGSSLGVMVMSLFDINTFYVAAVPLCWLAAGLALFGARPREAGAQARAR